MSVSIVRKGKQEESFDAVMPFVKYSQLLNQMEKLAKYGSLTVGDAD